MATPEFKHELEFVNTVDSRLSQLQHKKPTFELGYSAKQIDYRNLPSQNSSSQTGTQYTIYLNENQIISDYMVEAINVDIALNLTCNQANTQPFVNGFFGPRFLPLTNMSQNTSLQINGTQINLNPQNMLQAVMAFNKPAWADMDIPCCSMLDTFTDSANNVEKQRACLKNPLGDYFNSTYANDPRFGTVELLYIDNSVQQATGQTTRHWRFRVYEPVITGATSILNKHSEGFLGATTVQINRNFVQNALQRCVQYHLPDGWTINEPASTITLSDAQLFYTVYTPLDSFKPPAITYYPVLDYGVQSNTLAGGNVPANGSVTISSQTLSLNVLPKTIYAWLAVPNVNKTLSSSDATGFQITSVNVTFGGQSGIFSSIVSPVQLYTELMCGLEKTFYETGYAVAVDNQTEPSLLVAQPQNPTGLFGSVLRIPIEKISGIDWDKMASGSPYNVNLQVQVTGTNLSTNAVRPALFIQIVNQNILAITGPTTAQLHQGVLDMSSVEQVRKNGSYILAPRDMIGSGFFDKVKGFFKNKVLPLAKKAYEHRAEIASVAKAIKGGRYAGGRYAGGRKRRNMRGMGYDDDENEDYSDEQSYSEEEEPEQMRGGSILTKAQIQRRIKY
jgi:hypothetical protein